MIMVRKLTLLLTFIIFFNSAIHSQNQQKIDSLLNIASTSAADTNLVNIYEQITKIYIKTQFDSAKIYGRKMLVISENLGYHKGIAMGNNILIKAFHRLNKHDSTLYHIKKANENLEKLGESPIWAHSITEIANVYSNIDKYDSALILYNEALKFYQVNDDVFSSTKVLINIGKLYIISGEFTKAGKYLYEAKLNFNDFNNDNLFITVENSLAGLYMRQQKFDSAISIQNRIIKYYQSINDYAVLGVAFTNLGSAYHATENYKKAMEAHKKSLEYRLMVNDQRGLAITKMNIGRLYFEMEDHDSVLIYLNSSMKIFRKNSSMHPLMYNLLLTGRYYMKINQLKKAEELFLEAYNIAENNMLKEYYKNVAQALSMVYEEMHDYKNALKYAKIYKIQYDSLINEENIREQTIAEEGYKYKLQLLMKEKEIDSEKQKKNRLLIIGSVILMSLILLIFFRRRLQKTKLLQIEQENRIKVQNAKLRTQKDERKRVANILHDNLAHVILDTYSKVTGLIEKTKDAKPRQMLLQIEESLNFMNKLAKVASYELEFSFVLENNLVDQFKKYIGRVQHSYPAKINLQHSEKSQFDNLPDEVKINVFSVFQEMLGNAVKYSKAQHISIILFNDGKQTVLQVEDDGIGFDYNEERHGQGFPNMKERAAKLNGTFTYESEKGFGTKLKFVV